MKIQNTLKRIALVSCLLVSASEVFAINNHNPRLSPIYKGLFGGGLITDPPSQIVTVNMMEMGIAWDLNQDCGKLDPKISVSNQLNGITEGFENMMDNIISSATGAVANLPALALQRVHPGLYDLLMQGILQGKIDFEYAKLSCEDMANIMMGNESFPFENYKLSVKTTNWSKEISASGGDAIKAKQEMDDTPHADQGIEWACSEYHGGAGQPPINALTDVVKLGFNILHDKADKCDMGQVAPGSSEMEKYWTGPTQAMEWTIDVLGETEIRFCENCKKQRSRPGRGLSYKFYDLRKELDAELTDLVSGAATLSWQNLNRVSAPPGLIVDQAVIRLIRKRDLGTQAEMVTKLAGEIAMARLYEQSRFMIQLLRTGVKEPNISGDEETRKVIRHSIASLQEDLANLKRESELVDDTAQKSMYYLLGNEERSAQESEGTRDRRPHGMNALGVPK